jgi:hypothetical protein
MLIRTPDASLSLSLSSIHPQTIGRFRGGKGGTATLGGTKGGGSPLDFRQKGGRSALIF